VRARGGRQREPHAHHVADLLGYPLLDLREFPTPSRPEGFVREVVPHIDLLFAEHQDVGTCSGIGVAIAELVDLEGGLRYSSTLGWRDVDLLTPIQAATRLPVAVENSVKACVLAQVWAVPGDPLVEGPVAFVDASDGVGVGIAIDGKLLRGTDNLAGEFGHVALGRGSATDARSRPCARPETSWAAALVSAPAFAAPIVA
jgi:predicted NBD/HSP70 family sugar kinase